MVCLMTDSILHEGQVKAIKPGTRIKVVAALREEVRPYVGNIYTIAETAIINVITRSGVGLIVQYGIDEDTEIVFDSDEIEPIREH
jgi:hypothetical protein